MTAYYKVLRPVEPADLDVPTRLVKVLKSIPWQGHMTSEHLEHMNKDHVRGGITHALSRGILKRILSHERILVLDSVKFWCTQLNDSGYKNSTSKNGTRYIYLRGLFKFDEWLPGRSFQSYKNVMLDGIVTRQAVTKSFANVEEMMEYCNESDYGAKTAQRAVREYLAGLYEDRISASVHTIMIKDPDSFFGYRQ